MSRYLNPQFQVTQSYPYCRSGNFRVFKFSQISDFETSRNLESANFYFPSVRYCYNNFSIIYKSTLAGNVNPCASRTVYTVSSNFDVNRNITKNDKTVLSRCLVNPIIPYLRCLCFINNTIPRSFEAGNRVSNSSFKWRGNTHKQLSSTIVEYSCTIL